MYLICVQTAGKVSEDIIQEFDSAMTKIKEKEPSELTQEEKVKSKSSLPYNYLCMLLLLKDMEHC